MTLFTDYMITSSLQQVEKDAYAWLHIKHIFDNLHITVDEQLLLEGSGLYAGCYELAKYIDNCIFKSKNDKMVINTTKLKFKNLFTKEIRLIIDRHSKEEYAGYVFANSLDTDYNTKRWLQNENIFKFIEISIHFNSKTQSIIDLLIHELDHAYDDYQQYKNNGKTYEYKYIKYNYTLFNKHKGDDNFTELVRTINYIFIKFETHAYITQLRGEINKKFNNISEAYDFIEKNSEIWKQLKIVKNNGEYILQNIKYAKMYCDIYRNITSSVKDNVSILNDLNNNLNKYWKKIINHVYLLLVENSINENMITTIPSSRKFIKLKI